MLAGIRDIQLITTHTTATSFVRCSATAVSGRLPEVMPCSRRRTVLAQAILIGADHIGSDNAALVLGDNIFFRPRYGRHSRRCGR